MDLVPASRHSQGALWITRIMASGGGGHIEPSVNFGAPFTSAPLGKVDGYRRRINCDVAKI